MVYVQQMIDGLQRHSVLRKTSLLQAVLALFAAHQTSGIVVNIGFHFTTVAPGKQFWKARLVFHSLRWLSE